ncbi:dephospho-CoA kinase [Kaistia dalseonensis]|uniref:Dephospho-CoA kinase n=1 Tax=Kaistia dalseonensis TaxID=410840 RepID=A0ABU0H540_9HYPH|nr:dephospho-CoA kinase [Kaistia dalseonensis]MCX5494843.1 dephospho-CoA kinase [Kaistia dalseonensis]MDQ0437424.1 dephospho-CoA kinase [Kaistia dalseonensis]
MIRIGLTGSIGMGKSTVARFFAAEGAVIHDADAVVHALYRGKAVEPVGALFPEAVVDGAIDRTKLTALLAADPGALKRLEAVVHPLVHEAEIERIAQARAAGRRMIVLDIPLLLETGGESRVDVVVVASAAAELQRERVLRRTGMTVEKFERILGRQMPDAEKRRRAHFVVDTSGRFEATAETVAGIVRALAARAAA